MKYNFDFKAGEVLLINKPLEWSSFHVVKKIRFLLDRRLKYKKIKVGHAGTLDPLASGLMLICTGKKTKTIDSIQAQEKEYIADIRLGATTISYDAEQEPNSYFPAGHINMELIKQTLPQFIGEIQQTPPMFSAKMINGKRAYEYARAGENVKMKSNLITIKELEILSAEHDLPELKLRVVCSKGTYIRSLAYDLGKALNSGAYLSGLVRTRIGNFKLENAYEIPEFEKIVLELQAEMEAGAKSE